MEKIALSLCGLLSCTAAMAVDYSVSIVNPGTQFLGGGTAVNLYSTTGAGLNLIQTYILRQKDQTGNLARPLMLAINPAHTFVYVAYTGLSQPNIVGLKITQSGLVYQWETELQTGDAGLQGSTLTAGPGYVIENTYPFDLWVHVLTESGKEVLTDVEETFEDTYVVSDYVDSTKSLYYSCRSASPSPPVTLVAVFAFVNGVDVSTGSATPVLTSTDPTYIDSVCN